MGIDVSLSLEAVMALVKSAGISLDVSARKLTELPDGRRRDNERANYLGLSEALDALRDAQEDALLS